MGWVTGNESAGVRNMTGTKTVFGIITIILLAVIGGNNLLAIGWLVVLCFMGDGEWGDGGHVPRISSPSRPQPSTMRTNRVMSVLIHIADWRIKNTRGKKK